MLKISPFKFYFFSLRVVVMKLKKIHLLLLISFHCFLEKGREGGKEGGKPRAIACQVVCHTGPESPSPNQGPNPQPRCMPWQGIELVTFHFVGRHPTNWATSVKVPLTSMITLLWICFQYIAYFFSVEFVETFHSYSIL